METEPVAVNHPLSITAIARNLPVLTTPRLMLRRMTIEDARDMFEYARNPDVARYTLWDHHTSIDDSVRYLNCATRSYENGEIENWGIVYRENNKFIGTCGFYSWLPEHFRAELQYALSADYSGRGIMSEAVDEVIRFGFENMGLNRIAANCMPENIASERVLQKAGMRFEGVMREGVYAKGRFHNLKVYAILKEDWRTSRKEPR